MADEFLQITAIGEMDVDGETRIGTFLSGPLPALKTASVLFGEPVEIIAASELSRLRATVAELTQANAQLVVRVDEARVVLVNLCDDRGDDVLATVRAKWAAARAWLGGAK